jgi:anti-sigma factor RsiW
MMKCKECREQLSAYLDKELQERQRLAFELHVQTCQDCAALVDSTRRAVHALADMPAVEPPPDFIARLNQRLDREDERRSTRKSWFPLPWSYLLRGAATVAVVCIAVVLVSKFREIPVPAGQSVRQATAPAQADKSQAAGPAPAPAARSGGAHVAKLAAPRASQAGVVKAESKEIVPEGQAAQPAYRATETEEKMTGAAKDMAALSDAAGPGDTAPPLQKKRKAPALPRREWKGYSSNVRDFATLVIKDAPAWAELWSRHDPSAPVPEIDFSRNMIAAVFQGTQPPRPCCIKITGSIREGSRLIVFYSDNDTVVQPDEEPTGSFHMKAMEKSDGSVVFKKISH